MIEKSKVSVIVPIYNVEKYLDDCVESILAQDYSNLEIILIDDGSKDNSGTIADRYKEIDERVIVVHKQNGGVAAARNTGIKLATGEFLTFVDADDWIAVDYVSHLLYLQELYDSDVCMTTRHFVLDSDSQASNVSISKISNEEAAVLLLDPKIMIGTYNKLYRRSFIKKNSLLQNEQLFSGEGLHYMITAVQRANHVTISNKRIYYYRRNVSESATTRFNINMFTNNELALDYIKKDQIINYKPFDEMLAYFRVQLLIGGVSAIYNNSKENTYPNELKRWKQIIRQDGLMLVIHSNIPFKFKLKIVLVNLFPHIWAYLAKIKRRYIYQRSVKRNEKM